MSVSSVELWQRISASQLASPMVCRTWAAEALSTLSPSEATDGERVASALVAQGKLTQFQADTLISGSDEPLIRHGWRILEPVNFAISIEQSVRSVWLNWWVANKSPQSAPMWIRWINARELSEEQVRTANPSLPRAMRSAQIQSEHLQTVSAPEKIEESLQLSVQPLDGALLSHLIASGKLSSSDIVECWTQIAQGLSSIHAQGLAHGRVTPDRICRSSSTGQWSLLRDPLCNATLPITGPGIGLLSARLPASFSLLTFWHPSSWSPHKLPPYKATATPWLYHMACIDWQATIRWRSSRADPGRPCREAT